MFMAGDQVPVYPSKDVVGKGARGLPMQIGATGVNVGVLGGMIVIVSEALLAH